MSEIRIETFNADMTADAARMLARAFVTNPLHVAAFGADELARNDAFFRVGLKVMKGPKLVALDGSRILGLIHWVDAPRCQFSAFEKLKMTPAMIGGFGVRSALRVSAWLSGWSRHDPDRPHLHLGPIGVEPDAQGRRIGHQLMERYCEQLDRGGQEGYLETDRAENVAFYARFGFKTAREIPVLGVRNYLMSRTARPTSTRIERWGAGLGEQNSRLTR
jgi:ribosomal protein S18 acetylase RimI-like enzyme